MDFQGDALIKLGKTVYHDGMKILSDLLSNKRCAMGFFAVASALALGAAFVAQYGFGLAPCVLCIYQRFPYAIVIALGLAGALAYKKYPKSAKPVLLLTSITFAANSIIAIYHSGVERHWWKSFMEGCTVPIIEGNITDVLAQIAATPVARCDEIPWIDPVLGLSMANYNIVLCLILAVAALYAFKKA